MSHNALPPKQGLYDPQNEHDACGVGFVADIKGRKSHKLIEQGLSILDRLTHRGAVGADPEAGDPMAQVFFCSCRTHSFAGWWRSIFQNTAIMRLVCCFYQPMTKLELNLNRWLLDLSKRKVSIFSAGETFPWLIKG